MLSVFKENVLIARSQALRQTIRCANCHCEMTGWQWKKQGGYRSYCGARKTGLSNRDLRVAQSDTRNPLILRNFLGQGKIADGGGRAAGLGLQFLMDKEGTLRSGLGHLSICDPPMPA
jgi:hypothetical protein